MKKIQAVKLLGDPEILAVLAHMQLEPPSRFTGLDHIPDAGPQGKDGKPE